MDDGQNSGTPDSFGGVVGLGAEWMTSPNFSLRAEGLWYIFGGDNFVGNHDGIDSGADTGSSNIKLKDVLVFRIGATHHFSDIRLKRDVALLKRLDNGLGLYRYRYIGRDQVYVGVMAHEVAEIVPDAVAEGDDGYLKVDYARLGLRLMTLPEWIESMARPTVDHGFGLQAA